MHLSSKPPKVVQKDYTPMVLTAVVSGVYSGPEETTFPQLLVAERL